MTMWLPQRDTLTRPAYQSLADAAKSAIEDGTLKPGDRLPTHRDLAYQLDLSVHTVSRAYEELMRRGLVAARVGRGTFVRGVEDSAKTPFVKEARSENLIDCSLLKPVCSDWHLGVMQDTLVSMGEDLRDSVISSFRPANAVQIYRGALLSWLDVCGLPAHGDRIIVTNGNTSAMTIALMTVAKAGDVIATEDLGHHTLRALALYLGLKLVGVRTDDQGISPEDLARVCREGAVRAVYVMPSALNPRAVMMGADRRKDLVRIAREHDLQIIENDAWGPLEPTRPPPIAGLAPERTHYFTGFSKSLMPGLRLGCLVVPATAVSAAANRHLVTNWIATPLMVDIAARWIEDGTAERLLDWQRDALSVRNAMAHRALQSLRFNASPHGLHVWLDLPEPWADADFVAQAHVQGVAVAPGSAFVVTDEVRSRGIRISLGPPSLAGLESGLLVVSQLARSTPESAALSL